MILYTLAKYFIIMADKESGLINWASLLSFINKNWNFTSVEHFTALASGAVEHVGIIAVF